MNDAFGMRRRERLRDARDHAHALRHREAGAREALAERLAVDPLHGQIRLVAHRLAMGDIADDAWVRELLEDARFAIEALAMLAFVAAVEQLDGHDLPRLPIGRAEHGGHPTGADAALDLEALGDDGARIHVPE
jgi:hypothetical protein